jgi:hypothetical protein
LSLISAIPLRASSAAKKVSALAFCFAAKSLTSWVIFMLQNFGPHIEQKCAAFAVSRQGLVVILLRLVRVQA